MNALVSVAIFRVWVFFDRFRDHLVLSSSRTTLKGQGQVRSLASEAATSEHNSRGEHPMADG